MIGGKHRLNMAAREVAALVALLYLLVGWSNAAASTTAQEAANGGVWSLGIGARTEGTEYPGYTYGAHFTVTTEDGEFIGECTLEKTETSSDVPWWNCRVDVPSDRMSLVWEDPESVPDGYAPTENPLVFDPTTYETGPHNIGAYFLNVPVAGNTETGPTSAKIAYFALGDSIASGHGLGDEDGDDDQRATGDDWVCRRSLPKAGDSRKAYPYYVAEHLENSGYDVDFGPDHHLACSGATASDQARDVHPYKSLSNQVDDTLIKIRTIDPEEPVLVSITIGANEFGFGDGCNLFLWLYAADEVTYQNWADTTAAIVRIRLRTEINRLLNESPNVSVVVTEVFNPFNRDSIFFNAVVGLVNGWGCGLAADHYPSGLWKRTQYGLEQLNSNIHRAVDDDVAQPDRATVTTGLSTAFLDHASPKDSLSNAWPGKGECGGYPGGLTTSTTSTTWIQYPADPTSNSFSLPEVFPIFNGARGDCFHPNEKGARAIAERVAIAAYDVIYNPDSAPSFSAAFADALVATALNGEQLPGGFASPTRLDGTRGAGWVPSEAVAVSTIAVVVTADPTHGAAIAFAVYDSAEAAPIAFANASQGLSGTGWQQWEAQGVGHDAVCLVDTDYSSQAVCYVSRDDVVIATYSSIASNAPDAVYGNANELVVWTSGVYDRTHRPE